MKNKIFSTLALVGVLGGVGFLSSCGSDEASFALPTIVLSENASIASPGEEISVTVTATTDAAFESIVVTKLWDGAAEATQTITDLPSDAFTYTYTVIADDADHILSFNFLITDAQGKTATIDWIVTVELTPMQLLVKYDWRHSDEIRKKTNMSDINEVYQDDVYRFNEDGTYAKSNMGTADDFNDGWYNYCFYDLNETTMRLLMSRTGAFSEDVVDTVNITVITDTQITSDVTYYGLDEFNTGDEETPYESKEEYEKQYVAVAKTASFDPYGTGNATNADTGKTEDEGPGAACIEQTFGN